MEYPFFSNPWNPVHRPYYPVHHNRSPPPAAAPSKSKVISVPVTFVSEGEKVEKQGPSADDRAAVAAVRIQRLFRGFLVRKNVKVVQALEREAEEMERRLAAEAEAMRREEKERLRMNEMLMRLLLSLDSVRGVREYRRKVVKRVIALQERVDAIFSSPDQSLDAPVSIAVEGSEDSTMDLEKNGEESPILDFVEENPNSVQSDLESEVSAAEEEKEQDYPPAIKEEAPEEIDAMSEKADVEMDEAAADWEILEAERKSEGSSLERSLEVAPMESGVSGRAGESNTEAAGMREVMERVAAESERLRELVAELCERNAQQCRLVGGLAERVERLEHSVKRMEQSKKKRRAGGGLEKKCGQKKQD